MEAVTLDSVIVKSAWDRETAGQSRDWSDGTPYRTKRIGQASASGSERRGSGVDFVADAVERELRQRLNGFDRRVVNSGGSPELIAAMDDTMAGCHKPLQVEMPCKIVEGLSHNGAEIVRQLYPRDCPQMSKSPLRYVN